MTVKELREELFKYPEDIPVVISGYESGFDHISVIRNHSLYEYTDKPYYEGRFQTSLDILKNHTSTDVVKALILKRV